MPTGISTSGGKHRASHCRVREKCRQKTVHPLHFHLCLTLSLRAPRRNLLPLCWKRSLALPLLFLEEPLSRSHLLVWRPFPLFSGLLAPVPRSWLSVGWSLSQSVPLLVHVCSQTSMILMGATLTSVRHVQCQTPSTQKRQRLLSRRRHSLRSRTMCTPPGKDTTVKRRGAMSRRSSLRRADGPTGDPSCDSPADVASQGDQHRRTLCWLHAHKAPAENSSVFFCSPCGALHAGGTLRLLKSQRDGS